ncbi:MAG: helix-turn-helix domain-containing protein [bacterium]
MNNKNNTSVLVLKEDKQVFENNISSRGIWNVRDVAQFLSVSIGYIYNLKSKGKIPFRKRGKLLRFIPQEIFDWVNEGEIYNGESSN